LGYIGIVQHKEHSPEVLSILPGTPCRRLFVGTWIIVSVAVFPRIVAVVFCVQMTIHEH